MALPTDAADSVQRKGAKTVRTGLPLGSAPAYLAPVFQSAGACLE
jgi:hypothetical protein